MTQEKCLRLDKSPIYQNQRGAVEQLIQVGCSLCVGTGVWRCLRVSIGAVHFSHILTLRIGLQRNNSKKRQMRVLLIAILLPLLIGCGKVAKQDNNQTEKKEQIEELVKKSIADDIEVVSVETGWYGEQRPQVKIKFRNISGGPIDKFIKVKYQFVENDEVFDEGNAYLHSSADVNWDNGLAKTETYRSNYGYPYGGHQHKVRAKICFEDNSLVWEGNVEQKVIYQ